jgi:hypothetical protein
MSDFKTLLDHKGVELSVEGGDAEKLKERREELLREKIGVIAESWVCELANEGNLEKREDMLTALLKLVVLAESAGEFYA